MRAGAAHGVLLRVAPAVPRPLDCRIDQLEPLLVRRVVGRRQCEQLPTPVIADQGHHRLAAGPAHVAIGTWVVWVGRHQSLLDGEDKIVSRAQGGWRHWRIVASETNLQGADRLAQRLRRLGVIVETQRLDIVK
jgi:hypothetical protein